MEVVIWSVITIAGLVFVLFTIFWPLIPLGLSPNHGDEPETEDEEDHKRRKNERFRKAYGGSSTAEYVEDVSSPVEDGTLDQYGNRVDNSSDPIEQALRNDLASGTDLLRHDAPYGPGIADIPLPSSGFGTNPHAYLNMVAETDNMALKGLDVPAEVVQASETCSFSGLRQDLPDISLPAEAPDPVADQGYQQAESGNYDSSPSPSVDSSPSYDGPAADSCGSYDSGSSFDSGSTGLALVEILVVICILGVFVALLAPLALTRATAPKSPLNKIGSVEGYTVWETEIQGNAYLATFVHGGYVLCPKLPPKAEKP